MHYTPEQRAAIKHRGGALLVSSAAGAGKTMVLVERLLGYIDEGRNIDEFLVITYTRAAAAELRERIHGEISKRLSKAPGNKHLRRQAMLCRGAHIDTIHTFCSTLLRENSHAAGLAPDFRVADDDECALIRGEVMEDLLDKAYREQGKNESMTALLQMTVDGRDDRKLIEIISDIYSKLRSAPDPAGWICEQTDTLKQMSEVRDILQTPCGAYLMETLRDRAEYCREKMLYLLGEMEGLPEFKAKYGNSVNVTTRGIEQLLGAMGKGWDETIGCSNVEFPRVSGIKGYDELKDIRSWCKKELEKITKSLKISSDEHIEDAMKIAPAIEMLLSLVGDFDEAYSEEKKRRGVVDFSDLEHLTLSLLASKDRREKTQIAGAISKRFTEIMVDEYQDVNEVQDMLFNALSQEGNNIFMVGDVKQSIYRFRLAEPAIFLSKYRQYKELNTPPSEADSSVAVEDREGLPASKVNLSMNFRSNPGILEAANHLFRRIMSEKLGEMDYTDSEALTPGRQAESDKQGKQGKRRIQGEQQVEFDLLAVADTSKTDEEDIRSIELETRYVARRIKKLITQPMMIEQKDGSSRPIQYSDIAILARSVKGVTWRYASALMAEGIPSDAASSETYFETFEVQAAMSLLSVIDNPLEDIQMAAVLSGPVFEFTSDELSEIRAAHRDVSFYDAVKRLQESGIASEKTIAKCKTTLSVLNELRSLSQNMSSDRFIWNVYNKTGLLNKVAAIRGGEKRKSNLMALVDYAQRYEQSGFKGLFGLLQSLKGLRERGADISDTRDGKCGSPAGGDSVKIMSIHKSKGLEFPVVFLVGTTKQHNLMDLRKPFIFDKNLGIGGTITDTERRIRYTTLARTAIAEKQRRQTLSEELRVLYVAMTRAREKLIITAAYKDAEKSVDKIKLLSEPDGSVSAEVLMSMSCMGDWLIAGLQTADTQYVKMSCVNPAEVLGEQDSESCTASAADVREPQEAAEWQNAEPEFDFTYPYQASVNLPSKLTVTGLKSAVDLRQDNESLNAEWTRPEVAPEKRFIRRPLFVMRANKMGGAERGTYIHDIMRYIDYQKCSSKHEIEKDLQRIAKKGFIDENKLPEVQEDIVEIAKLFSSDLGERLMNANTEGKLFREFRFSLLTAASDYFDGAGDDKILIQGIIDCYFEENGELIVVDYKTDRVSSKNIGEKIEKYTPQLQAYSNALERITKMKVAERIIYFFATGEIINV